MDQSTIFLFLALALCGVELTGQSLEDSREIQWACTVRFGGPLVPISNFEPPQNGGRLTTGFRLEMEWEMRPSDKIGILFVTSDENLTSHLDPNPTSDNQVDLENPFGLVHPYTSKLEMSGVQLGAQFNLRVGSGDISFGAVTGIGVEIYSRIYDIITASSSGPRLNGVSYNESEEVIQWISSLRFQYTYWISRRFAISLGGQLHASKYLGGGIETPFGIRYDIDYQEVEGIEIFYNLNYDRSTLTPDPNKYVDLFTRLYLNIGFTSRF
jgi:hypothetical protein